MDPAGRMTCDELLDHSYFDHFRDWFQPELDLLLCKDPKKPKSRVHGVILPSPHPPNIPLLKLKYTIFAPPPPSLICSWEVVVLQLEATQEQFLPVTQPVLFMMKVLEDTCHSSR